MRRPQALLAAVLALALAPLAARAGEPLDLDLRKLGPPSADIWMKADPSLTQAQADLLAADARSRFALLASQLALSLSSSLLEPATTVGHSGFAFDLESSYTGISAPVVGTTGISTAPNAYPRDAWPTRTTTPSSLLIPSFHVRKAFPYSLEMGGRILYLSQSSYFAAQIHGKWAIQEGYARIPDVAVMAAHTVFLGPKDLDLSSTDLTLLISKRFGLNAVMSITPYLAARYLLVHAGSDALAYPMPSGTPAPGYDVASFPTLNRSLYRTTLGGRLTSYATTMALELTYFAGASTGAGPTYSAYKVPSALSGAFKVGFEF